MLTPLFAARSVWMLIFVLLATIGVVWFVVRVVVDTTTWLREEVVDDIRERKRKKAARKAKQDPGDGRHESAP